MTVTRFVLLLEVVALTESYATHQPWSDDLRACSRRTAAWALVPFVGDGAAASGREACMNERGWVFGPEGYRKSSPGEPTPAEMIAEACATQKRYGDSVFFQYHWVKCPDAGTR